MADTKISALPTSTTPLAGTEVLPIVQSGVTKQVSVANLTADRDVSVKNLAVSATLQTWYPYSVVNQFGLGGVLEARSNYAALSAWATNTYIDASGNDRYIDSAEATRFEQSAGLFRWKTAPSGTAGALCTLTNRMELANATGDLSLKTGNLVQGTAAKGVNFTANTPAAGMTSQLLNWYEEGTWTPVVVGTTTAGVGTYIVQIGNYTRIGNVVTFDSLLIWTNHTGTGNITITGLPYSAKSQPVFSIASYDLTFTGQLVAMIQSGSTISLRYLLPSSAWNDVPMDTAVGSLNISGSYIVA